MHKTLGLSLVLVIAYAAPVRAETEHAVVFEDTYLEDGYSAVGARLGRIGTRTATSASAEGEWRLGPQLSFGVRGDVLASLVPVEAPGPVKSGLSLYVLSGTGEAKIFDAGLLALTAGGAVGWGQAGYRDAAGLWRSNTLTAIEPEATGLLHLSHRLDVAWSLGYRDVFGLDLGGISAGDWRGVTSALMLRGSF